MTVRLRFSPSPSGNLHICGARTALLSWLYARRMGGRFILRIDDADSKQPTKEAKNALMNDLRWLGIDWDEGPDVGGSYGPYIQSERLDIYRNCANHLLQLGYAYKCFATADELNDMRKEQEKRGEIPAYDRRYRDLTAKGIAQLEASGREYTIRFKMPLDGQTIFRDLGRGEITAENSQLTDPVLLTAYGLPTYHLSHVVDDHLMNITHVTRGEEWLGATPYHIHLWQAFGWAAPIYAHMPVTINPSGKGKLCKNPESFQDEGQTVLVQIKELREDGFNPQAVANFLVGMGWSFDDGREVFTLDEAAKQFDLESIDYMPVILPYYKLDELNRHYSKA